MHEMLLGIGILLAAILCALIGFAIPILFYAAAFLGLVGLWKMLKGYYILRNQYENVGNGH